MHIAPTARTTVVRPADPTLRSSPAPRSPLRGGQARPPYRRHALAQHLGYSYFRDEFYYIVCGRHLAWGYVDHGPLVALQARLAETLFGTSILGIRLLSAPRRGSRRLPHRHPRLVARRPPLRPGPRHARHPRRPPVPRHRQLSLHELLRARLLDAACTLALIRILSGATPARLVAPLRHLRRPRPPQQAVDDLLPRRPRPRPPPHPRSAASSSTARPPSPSRSSLLIALPNLLWQIRNGWPTLEFLHNGEARDKNIVLPPFPSSTPRSRCCTRSTSSSGSPASSRSCAHAPSPPCAGSALPTSSSSPSCCSSTPRTTTSPPSTPSSSPPAPSPGSTASPAPGAAETPPSPFPSTHPLLVLTGLLILPMALPILAPPPGSPTPGAHSSAIGQHRNTSRPARSRSSTPIASAGSSTSTSSPRAYSSLSPARQARVYISRPTTTARPAPSTSSAHAQHLGLPPGHQRPQHLLALGTRNSRRRSRHRRLRDIRDNLYDKYTSVTLVGCIDDPLAMPYEHSASTSSATAAPGAPSIGQKRTTSSERLAVVPETPTNCSPITSTTPTQGTAGKTPVSPDLNLLPRRLRRKYDGRCGYPANNPVARNRRDATLPAPDDNTPGD